MRRTVLNGLVGICSLGVVGCVGVTASSHRYTGHDRVAVVGNRVFVIDTADGTAREVDLSRATPFVPHYDTQE